MTDETSMNSVHHGSVTGPVSDANAAIAATPLPSDRELSQRASLLRQGFRFVVLNLKILKLSRQHH